MTNIFEARNEARANIIEVSPEVAMSLIYTKMDMIQEKDFSKYEFGIFQDQDRGNHLVLKSDKYDEEQLDRLYNSFYLTGTTCGNRSRTYWKTDEARMRVMVDGIECEVDAITVASVIQTKWYGVNDMKLMSATLSWLYDTNRFLQEK
jgi:hypothetical protein